MTDLANPIRRPFGQPRLLRVVAFASALAFAISSPLFAPQSFGQTPKAGTVAQKPASQDYLVQVGKRVMWKSQADKLPPTEAKTAKPLSEKGGTDYLVQVGKTTVRASTLRRVAGPKATRPAPHNEACKDYLVQAGKQTVWASEIGVPCLSGTHKGENKPLCCVAPLEQQKNMSACCKEAH